MDTATEDPKSDPNFEAAKAALDILQRGRFYRANQICAEGVHDSPRPDLLHGGHDGFCLLRRQVPPVWRWAVSQGVPLELLFPFVGIMAGLLHRGVYTGLRRAAMRSFFWFAQRSLKNQQGRPGKNDELMARWFITAESWIVKELFMVAFVPPLASAGFEAQMRYHTARWMLHSVRANHSDLNYELLALEEKAGASLKPPDPKELSKVVGAGMDAYPVDVIGNEWNN
jgi:hypothetical protein